MGRSDQKASLAKYSAIVRTVREKGLRNTLLEYGVYINTLILNRVTDQATFVF